jgi:multiple sugar transport system permease protein
MPGIIISLAILVLGALFMFLPLAWMLSASLMPLSEVIKVPLVWFDASKFSLNNYIETWSKLGFSRFFLNSLLVAVLITAAQLLISSMASYALLCRLNSTFGLRFVIAWGTA